MYNLLIINLIRVIILENKKWAQGERGNGQGISGVFILFLFSFPLRQCLRRHKA
jgi:hypothetical protein